MILNITHMSHCYCWDYHRVVSGVLHYVLPVDRIGMAQELVLVHIHTSAKDFCGRKKRGCLLVRTMFENWKRWNRQLFRLSVFPSLSHKPEHTCTRTRALTHRESYNWFWCYFGAGNSDRFLKTESEHETVVPLITVSCSHYLCLLGFYLTS